MSKVIQIITGLIRGFFLFFGIIIFLYIAFEHYPLFSLVGGKVLFIAPVIIALVITVVFSLYIFYTRKKMLPFSISLILGAFSFLIYFFISLLVAGGGIGPY